MPDLPTRPDIDDLDRMHAAANFPALTVDEMPQGVLNDDASAFVEKPTGYISGLIDMGNGEEGFMTPEKARAVAEIINAYPAIASYIRALEARLHQWNTRVASKCTPGGSEFHDNPERVARHIRERQDTQAALLKQTALERNALRARLALAEKVAEALRDFYDGECHCDRAIKPCVQCKAGSALAAFDAKGGGG